MTTGMAWETLVIRVLSSKILSNSTRIETVSGMPAKPMTAMRTVGRIRRMSVQSWPIPSRQIVTAMESGMFVTPVRMTSARNSLTWTGTASVTSAIRPGSS